ncbi:partner and localizer of BRCA2 [Betta splendens]|uniref:Partner and localizer of BRCA2 n=1 Tax=Betta splendens TaxID=158456 RepID=A0A6P7MLU2_BETSP|nr:partner and localizer of BRCA2 [Betta splendens]XP_029007377.1 partner and localizer of BRCA2 [Betta splendens]
METNIKDILHCDEHLRSTLYYDDKEKLRRKLAQLQQDYIRTAQRLQRAERMDAVRRHVQSKITQHNQSDPEITSNPCLHSRKQTKNCGAAQDKGPEDSNNSKRSQVIRFQLPSDSPCPNTPDVSFEVARGYRPSPALRLRSRRSRLRWERRSAEAEGITDTREEGQGQGDGIESTQIEAEEEKIKSEETGVVNESEELSSASDSPSLLPTHWSTHANTGAGDVERKETEEYHEQRERENELNTEGGEESTFLPLEGCKMATFIEAGGHECTKSRRKKEKEAGEGGGICGGENEMKPYEENHKENTEQNERGKSLLDSCTLVEGLLFPAEYYVRTTRRMTLSQSQPDMQAVILSQLNTGRRPRSRGRKSVSNRNTQTNDASGEQTKTEFASQATTSIDPPKSSDVQAAGFSADLSQISCEISDQVFDSRSDINAYSSPTVRSNRPGRGRTRKRGRGRARPSTPRSSLGLDTNHLGLGQVSDSPPPTATPASPCLSGHSTAAHLSSGITEAQSDAATGNLEKVYPIFVKSNIRNNRCTQTNRGTSSWQSLLLQPSPSARTDLRPVPCQSLSSLASDLMKLDIQQDFHLPDDQFASLKLHKLQQVSVESNVEGFISPYNTRNRKRRSDSDCTSSTDPVIPLPLPLSLTPTIPVSPRATGERQATTQTVHLESVSVDHKPADQSLAHMSLDSAYTPGGQQTENLHAQTQTSSTETVSLLEHFTDDFVSQCKEHETMALNSRNKGSVLTSNMDRPAGNMNVMGHSDNPKTTQPAPEKQMLCVVPQTEDKVVTKSSQETPEKGSHICPAGELCNDTEAQGDSAVISSAKDSEGPSEHATSPAGAKSEQRQHPAQLCVRSQLLLSPSATCPFVSPHPVSSGHPSSPTLPSLGLTPHLAFPLTSSPSAPTLTLPPPHSSSPQAFSPPGLSLCPSYTSQTSSLPPASLNQCHTVDAPPRMQSQDSGGLVNQGIEESVQDHMLRPVHTLKAPAGSCLVDACCLPRHSGGFCVAAAGKWAVCLWIQISASNWSFIHTWTFEKPVISVFPVPDASEMMCVTLGQLEIREVRVLSCSSLSPVLLYEGVAQAVVGVSNSRVVLSSHSAAGSTLQVFKLSDSSSTPCSQNLMPPGVCIGALAPVDGLPDALIGTDECGHLFIWNLKTGQLLQRVVFRADLSHTACLRGYSHCGVLFVLLQHQMLSSLEEDEKEAKAKDQAFSEKEKEPEKKMTPFFSLVAVNPLSGKSVLATKLYPPKGWSGRVCEADVHGSSVVGLSQSGCVCVWELIGRGDPSMVWAPGTEGWLLARWGGPGVLVIGHHNGNITLHRYTHSSVCC